MKTKQSNLQKRCNLTELQPGVIMEIVAPRGSMRLSESSMVRHKRFGRLTSYYIISPYQAKQCRAIKLFMKEHKNDT